MGKSKFYQIKNITEHEYILVGCDGSVITLPIQEVDKTASAFTIQDAKDGDALVASDDSIFIFKEIEDCGCKHYIALEKDSETINVNDNLEHFWESVRGVNPSTKEQRDLLFQKIKEAGYEWNADKKELKKIEQKPDWSKEDERRMQKIISDLEQCTVPGFPIYIGGIELEINWLKSLKERMKGE